MIAPMDDLTGSPAVRYERRIRRVLVAFVAGFLLFLAAGVVGYTAGHLREAAEIRARAERAAAIHEERTRLARAVHDGVLQVLALVQRRASNSATLAPAWARKYASVQPVTPPPIIATSTSTSRRKGTRGRAGRTPFSQYGAPSLSFGVTRAPSRRV